MRRPVPVVTVLAVLVAAALSEPLEAAAQALRSRVSRAPDGWVRFAFEARPGVCGNCSHLSLRREARHSFPANESSSERECASGPVRVELRVKDGVAIELQTRIGGSWPGRAHPITDLGEITPRAAADYLLDLAESGAARVGGAAILPATLARDVVTWPRLLRIARDEELPRGTRRQAVFWLGQAAGDKAAEGLVSLAENAGELEVREQVIVALSQRPEERALAALIRIARTSPEPGLRRTALFWLSQRAEDRRVLSLFEELLMGPG